MTGGGLTDVHTHFFPDALLAAVDGRREPPCICTENGTRFLSFGPGPSRQYPLTPAMSDVEAKLAEMERAGITHSVLSVNMPGVDGLGDDGPAAARAVNDDMHRTAAAAPDRLSWLGVVALERPDSVAAEVRRCASSGACGVMIGSNVNGRPLSLDGDQALFDAAHEAGLAIMVHPSFPLSSESVADYRLTSILGFLFDTTTATLRLVLGGMFDRYPDLRFVVSHVGSLLPFIVGRIDYLSTERPGGMGELTVPPSEHLRRLYVDGVCLWPPALRLGTEFFGADHVMFGSDAPYWPMDRAVQTLTAVGLSGRDSLALAYATAAHVFVGGGRPPADAV